MDYRHPYPFVPARNFTPVGSAGGRRTVDLVVFHDMEAPELEKTAENVANYFRTTSVQVSSHYCIDADSIIQCVREDDVSWCAPGTNHNGIQLEHAGYASQSAADWLDTYSKAMLELSARLTATICRDYKIPIQYVSANGLLRGERGITTHADASRAFKKSSHTDPGPNFPMHYYVSRVLYFRSKLDLAEAPQTNKPWPTPVPKWFWEWAAWKLGDGKYRYGDLPRPSSAPLRIPDWAWVRLKALIEARKD